MKSAKMSYKQRLLEQNVESCVKNSSLFEQNTKEIVGLRQELELISKLLKGHENGNIEALDCQKRGHQLHHKISGGIITSVATHLEDLNKLSREQLINHFNSEMNQLKREHDYAIQEITEEYFSIKRRYLNLEEYGSFSSLFKDKKFNVARKKIPDIILKLDKILMEDEKSMFDADFKSQLDSLLVENRQLKDSLLEAGEKMSQLSQVEKNHLNLIRKLELDVEDSHVEASIYEDVYGSFVGEFLNQIRCAKEEMDFENQMMRETSESKGGLEDTCVESYMAEEFCTVIYKEALKEADKKLRELNRNLSGKEEALKSEMVEKERLKEKTHWLECLVKEKENLVQITKNDLATEKKKLEIFLKQMNNLRVQIDQQDVDIQHKNKELRVVSASDLDKTEGYEMEISELRENLELVSGYMKITENEKVKSDLKLTSSEAHKERLKNQFVSTVLSLAKWSQAFDNLECLVAGEMRKTNSRLKSMQSQLSDLLDQVDELKARESMYKKQMEKKIGDLQKAETEVDILGDEIDTLLNLLEKIYIALDHYSPILKHYPGIIEILKLVRRELRGQSKRLSVVCPNKT